LRLGLEDRCAFGYKASLLFNIFFRLKQFDESTVVSRKGSQAPTPPLSVKGIGNKGSYSPRTSLCTFVSDIYVSLVAKPDYSESKIVLCMVKKS
jgi:6-phosphofructo-2-kinase/fructose-2,6-biphosphatase 2